MSLANAQVDLVAVLAVLEMDLEVVDSHVRPGRVQLPGAVVAADTRRVHERDVVRDGLGYRHGHDGIRVHVDGAVAHDSLKGVVGIAL